MQTHRSKYWYDSACKTRRVFELKIALLSSKLTETRTEDRNGAIVCCSKQYMILPWKNDPTEIVGNWPEVKPEVFEKRDPCRNKIFRYKNPCIDCFWAFILTVGWNALSFCTKFSTVVTCSILSKRILRRPRVPTCGKTPTHLSDLDLFWTFC